MAYTSRILPYITPYIPEADGVMVLANEGAAGGVATAVTRPGAGPVAAPGILAVSPGTAAPGW